MTTPNQEYTVEYIVAETCRYQVKVMASSPEAAVALVEEGDDDIGPPKCVSTIDWDRSDIVCLKP